MMPRLILSSAIAVAAIAGGRPAPVRPAAAPEGYVTVSVDWLSQRLKEPDLVILEASNDAAYDKEHVPSARLLELSGPASLGATEKGAGPIDGLPSEAELHGKLEKLGISDGSHVIVVFEGQNFVMATRQIYLLKFAGVENVSLLDGGLAAWKQGGHPVTAALPVVTPGHFTRHIQPAYTSDYAYVQSHLHAPHVRIVDARNAVYYEGGSTDMGMAGAGQMAAGHIPGAKNIPFNSLFDDARLLLLTDSLKAIFRSAGVQPGDTVVAYCHVGLQATAVVLGARALGIPVRMYVGSFHDWSARKLPTEGGT